MKLLVRHGWQSPRRQTRRSAMTLVEVMVAVAVTSILAGVVVALLVGLRDWDRKLHRHSIQSEQMLRLDEVMRTDIRQAVDISLASNEAIVIHAANEKQTRYELSPEGCHRIVTTPDEERPSTDSFSVGRATSWTLAPGAPGRRPLYAITLHFGNPNDAKPVAPLVVHAAVGADTAHSPE